MGGGFRNTASGGLATVGGGDGNTASGGLATVGGGFGNTASGSNATVPGGSSNTAAGFSSFAAGRRAKANHDGTFVWADNTNADFTSTASDQFLVRARGGVGLGTNSPQAQLHVQEAINASATLPHHVAIIENTSSSTTLGPDVLALKTSAINPDAGTNFITFFDGDEGQSLGAIQGDGSGGVTLAGPGNDYAEWLPLQDGSENIHPGNIVAWTPRGITLRTGDALRLMVVSTQPIVAGNAPMDEKARAGWAPVAFVGQVPVRVRGPVAAGDFILPSGREDGTGMAVPSTEVRAAQVSRIVGRALESAPGAGLHTVKVLVGLPHNEVLQTLLMARDTRLAALETENDALQQQVNHLAARLAALEQERRGLAFPGGLAPGVGALFLVLLAGLVWTRRVPSRGKACG